MFPATLRAVNVEKTAGARTHLDIRLDGKLVTVAAIKPESPLSGLVTPGDAIVFLDGQPARNARDVAMRMVEASYLELQVHTPHDSEIAFLPSGAQLDFSKDKSSGLLRVTGARRSDGDLESGGEGAGVNVGDLLLAVASPDGVLELVDTPKVAQQRLREAQQASTACLVEVRVVRNPAAALQKSAPPVTRCVAASAVRRATPPPAERSPTVSGRSSPVSGESSSDGESTPHSTEGASWRSLSERHRRRTSREPCLHGDHGRSEPSVDDLQPRMLQVSF